ncbi:MAG: ATP-binding cassette domain-containing protein [Actinobacteria bacterium]|nr:ATP-binding cassette domain-containing protein [Actinomycetota bacterium]
MSDTGGLSLQGLTKVFFPRTVNEVIAVNHIDLRVEPGDFITVIGSNGSGKSTLLNSIAGNFPVTSGSIFLDGRDITTLPEHVRARSIGRVFQDPRAGTAPSMSIQENMAMAYMRGHRRGLRAGVPARLKREMAQQLAALGMGLETRLTAHVNKLSGGQRQAMSLFMATVSGPRLLLLDEHTAALDPKVAAIIMALTGKIVQERGLTTLMVTHNMELALQWGGRLIMMHSGKIILDVAGAQKESLTVADLIDKFHQCSGERLTSDKLLLE